MIVDSLTFLGESLFGHAASAAGLIALMDELSVERAVVCPLKPPRYRLETANDEIVRAVEAHAGRLVGFARVDPWLGEEAVAELERAHALGLRGLFLHPWEETFCISGPVVDPVLEAARGLGLPVIVASGYPWLSEGLQLGELARRFPEVTLVATNGAQLNISGLGQQDAELALASCPNLVIQTTGVYREDFIEGIAARLGPERVLYASGFPAFDPRLEIKRTQWAPNLDAAAKELILGGNAQRLLLD
jgi:predicted TIM-barrel fold metal-dependent hydrolase